jgi:hypothetical protein
MPHSNDLMNLRTKSPPFGENVSKIKMLRSCQSATVLQVINFIGGHLLLRLKIDGLEGF